jgi:hypothetical protein
LLMGHSKEVAYGTHIRYSSAPTHAGSYNTVGAAVPGTAFTVTVY